MKKIIFDILTPALRLLAICSVATLVLSLVNEFTKDQIAVNRQKEEKEALAKLVGKDLTLSNRYLTFPLSLTKSDFEEQILTKAQASEINLLKEFYQLQPDASYKLTGPVPEEKQIVLADLFKRINWPLKDNVNFYYYLKKEDVLIGYLLELKGSGFGGEMKVFAAFLKDGKLVNAVLAQNQESPAQRKKAESAGYMDKFIGKQGMQIPTTKAMLSPKEADAVSGASVTFMAIANALRAGSLWILQVEGSQ